MFLTAAESDHFITVFNADSPTLTGSLRTENEIKCLDICSNLDYDIEGEQTIDHSIRMVRPQEVLATVSKDGVLEVFPEPFIFGSSSSKNQSDNVKSRMMQRTRKATAQIRIRRNDKASTLVPLLNASFRGNDILMVWAEGGINLAFDTVQWRDEATGNIVLKDVLDIFKAKDGPGIGAVVMNGAKDLGKVHVDESRTVVANGLDADDVPMGDRSPEIITISSGEEESEYEEEGPLSQMNGGVQMQENEEKERETPYNADIEMEDVNAEAANGQNQESASGADADTEEPSFGDLIRANTAGVVDVQAAFTDPNAQSLVRADDRDLQQLPSGMSLGTVLTQSLRTNDTNLLETCFHVKNLQTVRATIERLDSSFATTLLQRLAERLHSRPGRAGSLMVWIQWTLVAHGGYLAGQPEIMKKLASLHRIVKERANSLHSLLSLKGKLDMLEAQMNLRKSIQARSRAAKAMDEGDEDAVIYVEGQEESSSGGEYEEDLVGSPHSERTIKTRDGPSKDVSGESDSGVESELDERTTEMPATVIGVANTDDEGSESEEDGFKDEEASSTDNDSLDEVSEDEIDHDSVDADSSDADTSPPPKRPAKSKLSNGIGRKKR